MRNGFRDTSPQDMIRCSTAFASPLTIPNIFTYSEMRFTPVATLRSIFLAIQPILTAIAIVFQDTFPKFGCDCGSLEFSPRVTALPNVSQAVAPEEYLEGDRLAEVRHDYVSDFVYVVAGASPNNNRIALNLGVIKTG